MLIQLIYAVLNVNKFTKTQMFRFCISLSYQLDALFLLVDISLTKTP